MLLTLLNWSTAIVLITLVPICNKFWLALIILVLTATTIGYESLRAKKGTVNTRGFWITFGIYILVGVGYPLRFWVGALAIKDFEFNLEFFLILTALEFYGWFVAILPWKKEIISITYFYDQGEQKNRSNELSKLHYKVMYESYLQKRFRKNPLNGREAFFARNADKMAFTLAMLFLLCAGYVEADRLQSVSCCLLLMIFTLGSYVFLLIPTLKKYDVLAPLKKLLFDFSRYLIEKYAGKETNSVLSFENSSEGSQDENDETD